jgi:L,D-transpeptidase catalytic domain
MSALRILALSYLASASVFVVAATLVAHPQLMQDTADSASALVRMVEDRIHPVAADEAFPSAVVRLTLAPAGDGAVTPRTAQPPGDRPADSGSASITILPDLAPDPLLPKAPAPSMAEPVMPDASPPDIRIARNEVAPFRIPDPPSEMSAASGRAAAAAQRLKASLTGEMAENFDLFLYVSTAEHGALAQRMYVFRKTEGGALKLAYDWAASTGREKNEISATGHRSFTVTPRGYYELDPQRMYRSYHSVNWDQDMPNAMFFNWERQGLQTGLAIHAASGNDIAKLGRRASAGCVHLSPENAATLYDLVRANYRGPVPRLAYDYETQTMSNRGAFMHDRGGNLKMADGYRVLVMIENYSGDNAVAELF